MVTTLQAELMAKKRTDDGKEPPTVAVKIDRSLAAKAKMIATDRGENQADYISNQLRAIIERDWAKMVRKMGGES